MIFLVKVLRQDGRQNFMLIKSGSESEVIDTLEKRNFYVLDIYKVPVILSFLIEFFNLFETKRGIKLEQLAEIFENLSSIYRSGVPITVGIRDISNSVENKKIKYILEDIHEDLMSGISFYNSIYRYKHIFGDIPVMLIKIGEETGTLEKVLKDISNYYKRINDIKTKTKQALIYPIFTLTFILGAMLFWLIYVFPKMAMFFKEFNVELPFITKAMLAFSEFMKNNIHFIIMAAITVFFLIKFLRKKSNQFKFITDKILLKSPIIGLILKYFYSAFISEYIKVMISAGVTINRSLELMNQLLNNEVYKKALEGANEMIISGQSISESFKAQNIFSPMIVRMIFIGENTGTLDRQFEYISTFFYEKLDNLTQNITKLIEPIVISIVGFFVIVIILSFLMPIYELISNLKM